MQFEAVKNEAGLNRFVMTPSKWIDQMNSVGIVSKSGRYGGGTYAHSDIALEFALWISAEFKLYKYYERIRNDLTYKKELNMKLENMKSYFCGITYSSSHGDYTASQLIGEHGKIKAVIDFASAVSLPVVWEIMRAYIQSSEACLEGKPFDLGDFLLFVKEYSKYYPLSKRDLEAMPYVYLFQLGRSVYGFKEYLQTKTRNKDKLLEFAFWRTDICRQISERVEEISQELVRL